MDCNGRRSGGTDYQVHPSRGHDNGSPELQVMEMLMKALSISGRIRSVPYGAASFLLQFDWALSMACGKIDREAADRPGSPSEPSFLRLTNVEMTDDNAQAIGVATPKLGNGTHTRPWISEAWARFQVYVGNHQ